MFEDFALENFLSQTSVFTIPVGSVKKSVKNPELALSCCIVLFHDGRKLLCVK